MAAAIDAIINRQYAISNEQATPLNLPTFNKYAVCNLRGGIGKTSLTFNLSHAADTCLAVDTCPQGNLSYFYDPGYFRHNTTSVRDLILPYLLPGLGKATRVAKYVGATNEHFTDKQTYYVSACDDLYVLPSQMATALTQAKTISGTAQQQALDTMLYALREEVNREMQETGSDRCLIDTSPFFAGATHLAWHAVDALLVPVRTDQQSVNSLNLLLKTLSDASSEFRRTLPSDSHTPKIQLIILTHCTWSTAGGARNVPNQQTKVYVEFVRDIISREIQHFTTTNPDNHILLLDDFLGTGRISTALSKPIALLESGQTMRINRVKTTVNQSVRKVQAQLNYINESIW
ncbi:MAG: ParA family protein [Pseudomonadota bacterium]